jgi:hypothetical protein
MPEILLRLIMFMHILLREQKLHSPDSFPIVYRYCVVKDIVTITGAKDPDPVLDI